MMGTIANSVVLFHGFSCDGTDFDEVYQQLSSRLPSKYKQMKMLAPDWTDSLVQFIRARNKDNNNNGEDGNAKRVRHSAFQGVIPAWLADYVQQLHVEQHAQFPWIVGGHSMGGFPSLFLANPDIQSLIRKQIPQFEISGVVLLDSTPSGPFDVLSSIYFNFLTLLDTSSPTHHEEITDVKRKWVDKFGSLSFFNSQEQTDNAAFIQHAVHRMSNYDFYEGVLFSMACFEEVFGSMDSSTQQEQQQKQMQHRLNQLHAKVSQQSGATVIAMYSADARNSVHSLSMAGLTDTNNNNNNNSSNGRVILYEVTPAAAHFFPVTRAKEVGNAIYEVLFEVEK